MERVSLWSWSLTTRLSARRRTDSSACATATSNRRRRCSPLALPLIVAVVFAAVLFVAITQPMLRRLGFRDATRRPRETALVIAGSLLGTALITGSFIVGDTLDSSIRAAVSNQLGPIDEIVVAPDTSTAERVESAIADLDDPRIDGVMTVVSAAASFSSDA